MDPASIISIAGAAGSLAFKCGTIVQRLHSLTERYKQAELTILSVIQGCRTIELAWSRIERWAANSLYSFDDYEELGDRLQLSIYAGQLFMAELEKNLASLEDTPKYSTLRRRAKILWNESMLRVHQDRIQRQVCVLTLLLELIQLPPGSDRTELLSIKEPVFRSVEESVRSIVPTSLSLCSDDAASIQSFEESDLCYAPFSFEDDLFTSYVYKRNFRVPRLHIKQLQQKPTIKHAKDTVEINITQTDDVSRGSNLSQGAEMMSFDTTEGKEHIINMTFARGSTEDIHSHSLGVGVVLDYDKPELGRSESVKDLLTVDTELSVANNHSPISDAYFESKEMKATYTTIGIERKPLLSPARAPLTSASYSAFPIGGPSIEQAESSNLQIRLGQGASSPTQSISLFSRVRQGDLEPASNWAWNEAMDNMLSLSADRIASPDITLMLKSLYDHDRPLFGTIMQVFGFMRGTRFMIELVAALRMPGNQVTETEDASLLNGSVVKIAWTSSILLDQGIAGAAAFRDLAASTGILNRIPTVLQLACAARKAIVVEYLLSLGRPLIPHSWKVHPFILATKRRCKSILELFFKLAKDTVSQLIIDLALAMVVNQDCALSGDWTDVDQNDNKRIRRRCGHCNFPACAWGVYKCER
ncbi:hypothetical protein GQ44DRAFT_823047 [Phaeosphaeriaceae sp. PMI808]|nr:hypothetical protein GQ44DRAFT_823047 [Phaeosphaeriaceae sp. PMI808]